MSEAEPEERIIKLANDFVKKHSEFYIFRIQEVPTLKTEIVIVDDQSNFEINLSVKYNSLDISLITTLKLGKLKLERNFYLKDTKDEEIKKIIEDALDVFRNLKLVEKL